MHQRMRTLFRRKNNDTTALNELSVNIQESSFVSMVRNPLRTAGLSWDLPKRIHLMTDLAGALFFMTCISEGIYMISSLENMQALIDSFTVLSFCAVGFYKFVSIKINTRLLKEMVDEARDLEKMLYYEVDHRDESEYESDDERVDVTEEHIAKYKKNVYSVGRGLSMVYWSTLVVFALTPLVEYSLLRYNNIQSDLPHVLPTWTPFDDNFIVYVLTVTVELVTATYCVSVHVAFDIYSISFMILISGQFSLLRAKLVTIAGSGNTYTLLKKRDARARSRIKKCHRHHVRLILLVRQLDKLLKPVMGFYFSLATLTLCTTAVQLTNILVLDGIEVLFKFYFTLLALFKRGRAQTDLSKLQLMSLVQYMCATLTQLFLYCRYGDSVVQESDMSKGDGVFASAWWALGPVSRRDLVLLIAGTSRPLSLRAGWFHSLTLPSFVSIVQTAYSYYAVLSKNS